MTTSQLVETIVRENENLGTFPNNTGEEIVGYMLKECSSDCKKMKKLGNIELCLTCKRRNDIVAELAAGLVKEIETAEIELKKAPVQYGLHQSRSSTRFANNADSGEKYSAMMDLGPHIQQLGLLTKRGQEDICDRIDELHALVKKYIKPVPEHAGGGSGRNVGRLEEYLHQAIGVPRAGGHDGNPDKRNPGAAGSDGGKMEADTKNGGLRNRKNKGKSNEGQGCGRRIN